MTILEIILFFICIYSLCKCDGQEKQIRTYKDLYKEYYAEYNKLVKKCNEIK